MRPVPKKNKNAASQWKNYLLPDYFTGTWSAKNRWIAAIAIFIAALSLRVIYFQQSRETPLMYFHHWGDSDMNFFDNWAQSISQGDWFNRKGPHPYHFWHKELAKMYFEANPEDLFKYQARADQLSKIDTDMSPGKALIYDWYGGPTFHQEPLYVYLIALTYKVFGTDVRNVYYWQMIMGALSCVLIFLIGSILFGNYAGLIAAIMALLSAPLMFFDMVMLRTSLTVFLSLLLIYLTYKAIDSGNKKHFLSLGIASAFAALNYSYFLLFPIAFTVWHVISHRKQIKSYLPVYGFLSVGIFIPLLPMIIRNVIVGIPPLSFASNAGITFITANAKISDPYASFFIHFETLFAIMSSTGGAALDTITETLKTHPNIASFLNLMWLKLKTIFDDYEIPNNINYYFIQRFVPLLNMLPVGKGIVAPLGIGGIAATIYYLKNKSLPLLIMLGIALFPMLYFTGLARHRAPLLAVEMILAGFLIACVIHSILKKKWLTAIVLILITALAHFWVDSNNLKFRTKYDRAEYRFSYDTYFLPKLDKHEKTQNWNEILKLTKKIIAIQPEYIDEILTEFVIIDNKQAAVLDLYANFYMMHSKALQAVDQGSKSEEYRAKSEKLRQYAQRINEFFDN
jgi:4-amino-4-deoxy-L-arabinose transferase-like glycosyltransferase